MTNSQPKGTKIKQVIIRACVVIILLVIVFAIRWRDFVKPFYPIEYKDLVEQWAENYEIDPYLVYAVIKTESSFASTAESNMGARGLMQLTNDTFEWIKMKINAEESLTFDDMYSPEQNIRFGCFFVAYCLDRYGDDVSTAAAAYHSGVGEVDGLVSNLEYSKDGVSLDIFPDKTMGHYVTKINKNYNGYKQIYGKADPLNFNKDLLSTTSRIMLGVAFAFLV